MASLNINNLNAYMRLILFSFTHAAMGWRPMGFILRDDLCKSSIVDRNVLKGAYFSRQASGTYVTALLKQNLLHRPFIFTQHLSYHPFRACQCRCV
uniref:Putative secreted protein n=1 Tax=Amblyomma triste TaxID=251400 RepID=A0A023G3V0_AMBTT